MIQVGSDKIGEIYYGSDKIKEVYVGSELVWSGAKNIIFADAEVRAKMFSIFGSESITQAQAESVTNMHDWFVNNSNIVSFDEITHFINVTDVGGLFAHVRANTQKMVSPPIFPDSVQNLNYTFQFNTKLESFAQIPAGATTMIGCYYEARMVSGDIISHAITPPIIDNNTFNRTQISNIYVPDASVQAYKTAPTWIQYIFRIKPISEKP